MSVKVLAAGPRGGLRQREDNRARKAARRGLQEVGGPRAEAQGDVSRDVQAGAGGGQTGERETGPVVENART